MEIEVFKRKDCLCGAINGGRQLVRLPSVEHDVKELERKKCAFKEEKSIGECEEKKNRQRRDHYH